MEADVAEIDSSGLRPLQSRPSFGLYLRQLWDRRHFIWVESRAKALRSGENMFLGSLWLILNPVLELLVYVLIFGFVLKTNRGVDNFVGFLTLGIIYFGLLSAGLSRGQKLIQNSRSMIASFQFPRAALAVSASVRDFIDKIPSALVAILVALVFQLYDLPSLSLILVVPLYFLIYVFNTGVTLVVARITALIPDAVPLVSLVIRALFFLSGVFYPIEMYVSGGWIHTILTLNPFHQFLAAIRAVVLDGSWLGLSIWGSLIAWAACVFVVGLVFFWQAEARYSSVK